MTIMMTSDADLELAAEIDGVEIANSGIFDPMSMLDQLPETSIPVGSLEPGFYLRQEGTDTAHVRLLADVVESVELPPILVQKNGSRVIDGLHRMEVAKLRGEWAIRARIIDCTDEEALVLAVRSNTLHGLPLSRADRISSAKRILAAHVDWSDRAVAGIAGLSAKTIASLRNSSTGDAQFHGKRLGRDGKRRPVMAAEGRLRAAEYINAHPEASLRQVARETDVSLGTVHDVRDKIRRGAHYAGGQSGGTSEEAGHPAKGVATAPPSASSSSPSLPAASSLPARTQHSSSAAGTQHSQSRAGSARQLAWSAISAKLSGDPTLRYTEGGRAFLRWMTLHSMQGDEWREFIDAIPQHWLKEVSRVAAGMSEEWRQFADQLAASMV